MISLLLPGNRGAAKPSIFGAQRGLFKKSSWWSKTYRRCYHGQAKGRSLREGRCRLVRAQKPFHDTAPLTRIQVESPIQNQKRSRVFSKHLCPLDRKVTAYQILQRRLRKSIPPVWFSTRNLPTSTLHGDWRWHRLVQRSYRLYLSSSRLLSPRDSGVLAGADAYTEHTSCGAGARAEGEGCGKSGAVEEEGYHRFFYVRIPP